jgi:hypothetical protein
MSPNLAKFQRYADVSIDDQSDGFGLIEVVRACNFILSRGISTHDNPACNLRRALNIMIDDSCFGICTIIHILISESTVSSLGQQQQQPSPPQQEATEKNPPNPY